MTVRVQCPAKCATAILFGLIVVDLALVSFYVLLHVLDLSALWQPLYAIFELDGESNIPEWFSTLQLSAVGLLLAVAAHQNQHRQKVASWLLLVGTLVFVALSADEGAKIHERLTGTVKALTGDVLLIDGQGGWIAVYAAIAAAGLLVLAKPLWKAARYLPSEALTFIGGAVVLVGGAVGVEVIGYLYLPEDAATTARRVQVATEEFLEMLGGSLLVYGALRTAHRLGRPASSTRMRPVGSAAPAFVDREARASGEWVTD